MDTPARPSAAWEHPAFARKRLPPAPKAPGARPARPRPRQRPRQREESSCRFLRKRPNRCSRKTARALKMIGKTLRASTAIESCIPDKCQTQVSSFASKVSIIQSGAIANFQFFASSSGTRLYWRRAQRHPRSRRSILAATVSPAKDTPRDVLLGTDCIPNCTDWRDGNSPISSGRLGATTLLHEAYLNMAKGVRLFLIALHSSPASRVMRGSSLINAPVP